MEVLQSYKLPLQEFYDYLEKHELRKIRQTSLHITSTRINLDDDVEWFEAVSYNAITKGESWSFIMTRNEEVFMYDPVDKEYRRINWK
jgi:hypothetical protein